MSKLKAFLAFLSTVFVFVFTSRAEATHFRYGNIRYTIPDPINAPRTVRFDVVTAWRAAFIGQTTLDFGDGTNNGSQLGVVIGEVIDPSWPPNDTNNPSYKVMRYTATHTYPAPGIYTATFGSCCRISTLTNAADADFDVSARVDVTPGNTGNPATVVPAFIHLQTGGVRTIQIPAIDPDGTPVTCRFATPVESGSATAVMPPLIPNGNVAPTLTATSNPPGCTLTWNTTTAMAGEKYAIQVWLESANAQNGNMSSSVVDFIVEMVQSPPPTCTGGGLYTVDMGQSFNKTLTGAVAGGGNLTVSTIGSIGLLTPFPGTTQPSPFNTNFSWSPGLGEDGTGILAVVYTTPLNVSGFCTVAINVPSCAQFGMPCSAGIGACESSGKLQCNQGNVECTAVAKMPMPEICNGLDDDCDDKIDMDDLDSLPLPEVGDMCTSSHPGICSAGLKECVSGMLPCVPNIEPGTVAEKCNGIDEDCNAVIDNGFSLDSACTLGNGVCSDVGKYVCDPNDDTKSICDATPSMGTPEICDGFDNDCDNKTDEDLGLGLACSVGIGTCKTTGVNVCDGNGGVTCGATPGTPELEDCADQLDNDCDGVINNGCGDGDGDGLVDGAETASGSDPDDADTDDDGLLDGDEPVWNEDSDDDGLINVLDVDSDNDGLFDGTEMGKSCGHPATAAQLGHCRADADSGQVKTDPIVRDSDDDGVTDGSEDANLNGAVDAGEGKPTDNSDASASKDFDGDGLSDALEAFLKSNSKDADSDDDGHLDGDEHNPSDDTDDDGLLNVNDVDSDDDALFDGLEAGKLCTHPATNTDFGNCRKDDDAGGTRTCTLLADTDHGGATDGSEDINFDGTVDANELDPNEGSDDGNVIDSDNDGISDGLETALGTDPQDADSDDDGLLDGEEVNPSADTDGDGTKNIKDADSDNDGLADGTEAGSACNDPSTDLAAMMCIPDADNGKTKTSVVLGDTDGGTKLDGAEDANHNGVVDEDETDPLFAADDLTPPAECKTDSDCGDATSGRLCDQKVCIDGCRGTGGNGCPTGMECSSTTDAIGTCSSPPPPPPPPVTEPEGCACRTASSNSSSPVGFGLGLAAAAVLAMRRRKR